MIIDHKNKKSFIQYTRDFAIVSIIAGILFAFGMSLKIGVWYGLLAGTLFASVFGLLMASFLILFQCLMTEKLPKAALNCYQINSVQVGNDLDTAYQICLDVLTKFDNIKELTQQDDKNTIHAITKALWASFGESIALELEYVNQRTTEVRIVSRPIIKLTKIDYGKNYKNVEWISKHLISSAIN